MFSTILLDLDGTITNPYIGITNGVMYAYEHLGLEVPERESLRSFIGPPLIVEFTRRGLPEEQAREAVRLYREYYGETGLFENELIPGTVEFLRELKQRGKRVCLATSKPEQFSVRILERFGIAQYFIGAHDAGMKCAAVLVGFGSREEFAEYKADYVAETLADVLKYV